VMASVLLRPYIYILVETMFISELGEVLKIQI
jgi:hypothetical protein